MNWWKHWWHRPLRCKIGLHDDEGAKAGPDIVFKSGARWPWPGIAWRCKRCKRYYRMI